MATRISQSQLNKFISPEAAMAPYERAQQDKTQRNAQDAALAQLVTGGEIKESAAQAERDRNLRDLITTRKLAGPDARITSGDIGYDPRTDVAGRGKAPEPTTFQKAFDTARAKSISEDIEKGGPVRRAADVTSLKGVESTLGKSKNISGPIIGQLPMWARSAVLPESARAQQDFEAIAQRTLKETLGGQFAQKEGEEFFKRAYDPRLPEPVLQRRVAKARQIAEMLANEKQKELDYATQTGSLTGYRGMDPNEATRLFNEAIAEFDKEEGKPTAPPQGVPSFEEWRRMKGGR